MNGNGVPMPVAPHNRSSSGGGIPGQGREYGGAGNNGMAGFMGARSPPKSKSEAYLLAKENVHRLIAPQTRHMFPASSTRMDNVRLGLPVNSLTISTR